MSSIGFDYAPSAEQQACEDAGLDEYAAEHDAAIETCFREHGLDLRRVSLTDLGDAAARIVRGEPWCQTDLAGLQFYDYGVWCPLLERRIMPEAGDRLSLVRAPDNPHDPNAVEVWFQNGLKLGHLPRSVAAIVAGPLDEGEFCSAYVADGGTGEAWTAKAILVGEPVRFLHERRIGRVVRQAIEEHQARERAAVRRRRQLGQDNGSRFASEQADRRQARLVQAARTLLGTVPLIVEPPPVGETIELYRIESLLGVSRSTARRIAERAGCRVEVDRRGWYATGSFVTVTAELQEAIREWAARPLRIRTQDVTLSSGSHLALRGANDADDDIPF